jgi:hypothetical protein
MRDGQLLAAIRHLGGLLDDLEGARIATGNRIGAMEREYGDAFGLDAIQGHLVATEHQAQLELIRMWRRHPLAPWAKAYLGVGEKSIARLVAIIGDPAERPNVGKLHAYCGLGDPARIAKRKGMTQAELFKQGNPRAKKQVWLIATSLLKAGNRDIYDARRLRDQEAVHEAACVRCGPAGHPALPGSPLSDGHKHARALRALGKSFLLDLWLAAHALHIERDAHVPPENVSGK